MTMRVEEIAAFALELPSEARALLADRLVESLDPAEEGYVPSLWADEANRRLKELRSGQVSGIPGEEAMTRLRKKYPE
jgi:putative addiction module component (TIGR02574 family)